MKCWPLLLLLVLAPFVRADVSQQLEQTPYIAWGASQPTLGAVLRAATPITVDGQRFIGFTRWAVNWRFLWYQHSNGRCQIRQTQTRLTAQMSLPDLRGGDRLMQAQFSTYLAALTRHEMGHYSLAQAAAQAIDQQLQATTEHANCTALQRAANSAAQGILEHYQQQENAYDRSTEHGKTQGAVLPN